MPNISNTCQALRGRKASKNVVLVLAGTSIALGGACATVRPYHHCPEHRHCGSEGGQAGEAGSADSPAGRASEPASSGGAGGKGGPVGAAADGGGGTLGNAGNTANGGASAHATAGTSGSSTAGSSDQAGGPGESGAPAAGGSGEATNDCARCPGNFSCDSAGTCSTTCNDDNGCRTGYFCSSGSCRISALEASAGYEHACILLSDKTVQCWGLNEYGEVGVPAANGSRSPVLVKGLDNVQGISAGMGETLAVLADHSAVVWGTILTKTNPTTYVKTIVPTAIEGLDSVRGTAAFKGFGTAIAEGGCALLTSDNVQCWGLNDEGQLGNGTMDFSAAPVDVQDLHNVSSLSAGAAFACALADGIVNCWGINSDGELGSQGSATSSVPLVVAGLSTRASKLSVGSGHACALVAGGTLECWGMDDNGQLGNGTVESNELTPVDVMGLGGIVDVSAGWHHTCAVSGMGDVYCWGSNSDGQLGDGNSGTISSSPVAVANLAGRATSVSCGAWTTCALLENGSVQCWGRVLGDPSQAPAVNTKPTTVW